MKFMVKDVLLLMAVAVNATLSIAFGNWPALCLDVCIASCVLQIGNLQDRVER